MVRLLIENDRTAEHQPGRLRGELTSQEINDDDCFYYFQK